MPLDQLSIEENTPLRDLTTFGIGGPARYYLRADSVDALIRALQAAQRECVPCFILGGGSNVLVSDRGFDGLVIHVATAGITTLAEDAESITLQVAAGEVWDQFVAATTRAGWWGVENLSLIPGRVGAFPIQNVGAYGQEAGDVVQSVQVWDRESGMVKTLTNSDCHFGYRSSIFNTTHRGRYVILHVIIRLNKQGRPNLSYRGLREYFDETPTTPGQMRTAVIHIREQKLPDPDVVGSAGSFFKNVILDADEFSHLQVYVRERLSAESITKLAGFRERYPSPTGIKIPTAFLIQACGMGAASLGGAALSPQHALILTNASGDATADDVMRLARRVRQSIYQKTGLVIHLEPTLVGFSREEMDAYLSLSASPGDVARSG
ncbi:MAG: UDP-N-acetylmuramate dehydrogenase [Chloroflexota bacterium]|nr:UDP-N-acetylmuramate dehydrogenase [Chloroflexota bacterium]